MITFNIEAELAARPGREVIPAEMLNDGDLFECLPDVWHKAVDFAYGVTRMAIEIETGESIGLDRAAKVSRAVKLLDYIQATAEQLRAGDQFAYESKSPYKWHYVTFVESPDDVNLTVFEDNAAPYSLRLNQPIVIKRPPQRETFMIDNFTQKLIERPKRERRPALKLHELDLFQFEDKPGFWYEAHDVIADSNGVHMRVSPTQRFTLDEDRAVIVAVRGKKLKQYTTDEQIETRWDAALEVRKGRVGDLTVGCIALIDYYIGPYFIKAIRRIPPADQPPRLYKGDYDLIEIETHEGVLDEHFGPGDGPVFYLPPEFE